MISLGVLVLVSAAAGFNVPGFSSNRRVPNSCATLTGGTCIFPFTYNGATHYQCTYTDSPTPWCATAVDSSGVVVTNGWGDCEVSATSACQTESITVPTCTTTSGPRPGQSCVFPFRHLGVVYNSCTSVGQSAAWCSTSTTSAGTHIDGEYGFCPSTCPTESSSSATTTTTAAPTTTTTTPSSSTACIPGSTFPQDCNVCVSTLSVSPSAQQTPAVRALQFLVPPLVPPASSLSLMEESPTRVAQSGFTEGSTRANIGALLSGPHRHPCERR